jgi:minor extracellular serine protease Vpr
MFKKFIICIFAALLYMSHVCGQSPVSSTVTTQSGTSMAILVETDGKASTRTALEAAGCVIRSKANTIWSVSAPYANIAQIKAVPGVKSIDLPVRIRPNMDDSSRRLVNVKQVHAGTDVPMPYKGKNVVVGVIDAGFDYTHKAFYDANGNCRIRKVWEQSKTGQPPAGFGYGNELSGQAAITAARYDRSDFTHGTQTAGIAAGSSTSRMSSGMAPESDIVLVSLDYGSNDFYSDMHTSPAHILDGIRYIFDYARNAGKPAVVNISWGHHAGPHDGTGLLDKAIENLVDSGLIVVVAAGNEGTTGLHLTKTLQQDTFYTYSVYGDWVYGLLNTTTNPERNMNDFWGSPNSSFSLKIQWRQIDGSVVAESPFFPSATDSIYDSFFTAGNDTLRYQVTTVSANSRNQRPEIFVDFTSRAFTRYRVSYAVYSENSTIHAWNCGYKWEYGYGWFMAALAGKTLHKGVAGDDNYTVGECGANSRASITTGAYNANTDWYSLNGSFNALQQPEGPLTFFSSKGPSLGGFVKPDITAPGYYIGAPHSKFSAERVFDDFIYDRITADGVNHDYEMTSGTSMAAPVVTGTIALMLEADPKLTYDRVRTILQQTAINDIYTGNARQVMSAEWGAGKVNALSAMRKLLQLTGLGETDRQLTFTVYPNPVGHMLYVNLPANTSGIYTINISDLQGRTLLTHKISAYEQHFPIDMSQLDEGLYFVTVEDGSRKGTQKVLHTK